MTKRNPARERILRQAQADAERARILAVVATPDDSEADDDVPHEGSMIALFPSMEAARQIAVKGGEKAKELHVTLAYLGKAAELTRTDELLTLVQDFATQYAPLSGEVAGLGLFKNPSGYVTYASVDIPDLPAMRQTLVEMLDGMGFPVSKEHGYTPHMTLAYEDRRDVTPENVPLSFGAITVAIGGVRHSFDFTGTSNVERSAKRKKHKYVSSDRLRTAGWFGPGVCAACGQPASDPDHDGDVDSPGQPDVDTASAQIQPLNVTVIGGPTPSELWRPRASVLTPVKPHPYQHPALPDNPLPDNIPVDIMGISPIAYPPCAVCGMMYGEAVHNETNNGDPNTPGYAGAPAFPIANLPGDNTQRAFLTEAYGRTMLTAPAQVWEKALSKNEHFLWMQGRFVGGEKANRNGALWSNKDLELGHPTVAHGPLNWLHESRHIIGTIADAKLIPANSKMDGAEHSAMDEPHIAAMSAIWKWIYPDEAWVVENASDSGKLWYSMECISKNVECVGLGSCGQKASYADYTAGKGCAHMRERSTTRRFDDPTFLGGAVIVPPVRPGWADADARVLHSEAAALAERTFDAANAQVTATEWELVMGEVLKFAAA